MCQRLFQQQLAGGVSSLLPESPVWRKLEPGPAASMIMLGAFMRAGLSVVMGYYSSLSGEDLMQKYFTMRARVYIHF
jgi:hypothetical protein